MMYSTTINIIESRSESYWVHNLFIIGYSLGTWALALAPLSRLTYGAYLAGLTIQLFHVSTVRTPTYFSEVLMVSIMCFSSNRITYLSTISIMEVKTLTD